MSEYSERLLVEKLSKLVDTQDSITQTSYWIIHHRLNAQASVSTWLRELKKAAPTRKLSFLYLANDVVQTSRKKGEELVREFAKTLPDAFIHIYRTCLPDSQKKVLRILQIWEDRGVYPAEFLGDIRKTIKAPENGILKTGSPTRKNASSSSSNKSTPPVASSTSSVPAEIRPMLPLCANIEKQQAIVTDVTVQLNKMPQDWLQQDLAAIYQEHSQKVEATAVLEGARRKLQTLKSALANELKNRQLFAAELLKLQQANDLALKGAQAADESNETHLAIVDIQLRNLKDAVEVPTTALSSNHSDESPTISPILPISSNHQGTPDLLTNESNGSSSAGANHERHSSTPPLATGTSDWTVTQDGLLGGDLSNTDLTNWGS